MGKLVNLPDDILGTIIIMLVTSCNGATELARLSATCSLFWRLAGEPFILKAVNFENISTNDYGAHHHMNDFLCLCARAGNLAAQSMLGKALMKDDYWFWSMIEGFDTPLLIENPWAPGLLRHPRLVRSFICHASSEDVAVMRMPFFYYMVACLGHDIAFSSGILDAASNFCFYELKKRKRDPKVESEIREYVTANGLNAASCGLAPLSGPTYREQLLEIFDVMFPLSWM